MFRRSKKTIRSPEKVREEKKKEKIREERKEKEKMKR